MNLKELEHKYKEMGEEIERLKNQPNKKRWRAEIGETYWHAADNNTIYASTEEVHLADDYRYSIGNYSITQEEAELKRDRDLATQRVLDALREAEGDWVADWDDKDQGKCIPYIDHDKSIQIWWGYLDLVAPTEWHSSRAAWQQVIESHKSDIWLIFMSERVEYKGYEGEE